MTICSLLVLFAFTSLVPLHYRFHEPFHANPVPARPEVRLRNDSMGEGHFGASRSGRRTHNGIDILAAVGDPVIASKSGRVIFASAKGGYGLYVQVLHPDGTDTRYAHLSRIDVQTGRWIHRGTTVGLIGKTGNAQSRAILPHLHYEIRRGETVIDPTREIGAVDTPHEAVR